MGAARVWTAVFVDALISFAFAALVIVVDPYGMVRFFNTSIDDMALNIVAPDYPTRDFPKTKIVLVSDRSLANGGMTWPLSYASHAEIIDSIVALGPPRALVVDFLFIDERASDPTFPALVQSIERAARTTHVFLAVAPQITSEAAAILAPLQALAQQSPNVTLVSVSDLEATRARGALGLAPFDGFPQASVAVAENRLGASLPATPQTLKIWWSAPPAQQACAGVSSSSLGRLARLVISGVTKDNVRFAGLPERWNVDCRPLPTWDIDDVMTAPEQIGDAFSDATIFYGADFRFSTDHVKTAMYGQLPGVFSHAMAYDNLARAPDRFWRAEPPFGLDLKAHLLAMIAFMCALGVLLNGGVGSLSAPKAHPKPKATDYFLVGATLGMAIIGLGESLFFRVAPGVWYSALAIFALRKFDWGIRRWALTKLLLRE